MFVWVLNNCWVLFHFFITERFSYVIHIVYRCFALVHKCHYTQVTNRHVCVCVCVCSLERSMIMDISDHVSGHFVHFTILRTTFRIFRTKRYFVWSLICIWLINKHLFWLPIKFVPLCLRQQDMAERQLLHVAFWLHRGMDGHQLGKRFPTITSWFFS